MARAELLQFFHVAYGKQQKTTQNGTMRNGVIGSTADSDSVSRGSSPFSVAWNL